MTFEVFNKLACNNRMVLLMAIDLLMQNGRTFLQNTEITVLVTALKTDTKKLFAEYLLEEIVNTAKELAPLRTCQVLDYVKRSELDFKKPSDPESGICPICGDALEYGVDELSEDGGSIEWTCSNCGVTGEEYYKKVSVPTLYWAQAAGNTAGKLCEFHAGGQNRLRAHLFYP